MNDTTSNVPTRKQRTVTGPATAARIRNQRLRKIRRQLREMADMPADIWRDAPAAFNALVTLASLAPDPDAEKTNA